MSEAIDAAEDIVLDYDLDAAPEKVWRALTRPELVAEWLGPGDIAPEVGRRFALETTPNKPVDCEVIEADPERKLSYRWREAGEGGALVDSTVTFEVTPTPLGGSHLRLVHSGFRAAGAGSMTSSANDNRPGTPDGSVDILMLSLSKHKGISGSRSRPQQQTQGSLKWAA